MAQTDKPVIYCNNIICDIINDVDNNNIIDIADVDDNSTGINDDDNNNIVCIDDHNDYGILHVISHIVAIQQA